MSVERIQNLESMVQSLEDQLNHLYREKENLHRVLGVSDDASIIRMVKSLEAQLIDLYGRRDVSLQSD